VVLHHNLPKHQDFNHRSSAISGGHYKSPRGSPSSYNEPIAHINGIQVK
jgi:hypothetical protein